MTSTHLMRNNLNATLIPIHISTHAHTHTQEAPEEESMQPMFIDNLAYFHGYVAYLSAWMGLSGIFTCLLSPARIKDS